MNIILNDKHEYFVDGVQKPSQSEIVRYFFRDEYMPPQHILDYAAEKGKAIHKAIELYEKDDLGELPKWLEPYLEQWKLFRKGYGKLVVIEKKLYSKKYDFCGTVDMMFPHGLILDLKSGQKSIKHKLQTTMYSLLIENNQIFYGPTRACLYIKENSFDVEHYSDPKDYSLVTCMIEIFHWAKENKLIKK